MTTAAAQPGELTAVPLDLPAWQPLDVPGYGPGITMDLEGSPVWFASPDVRLEPGPEAATCLLAYPCLAAGRPLRFTGQRPGATFLGNVRSATDLMAGWWGLPSLEYLVAADCPPPPPSQRRATGTALFFSGGLDSFYSLFRYPGIDTLVFITGFDVRLANRAAADAMIADFRRIAAARGLRLVTLATNLRDHPLLGGQRWARYHGAAKLATTHLLRRVASRFVASASYHHSNLGSWGSHPDLDWRWGDDEVAIDHFGTEAWRGEKLLAVAGEPLVHATLRVCYPSPPTGRNCGRCEKCVRTRLHYHACLPGMRCATMPDEPPLAAALDALARVDEPMLTEVYRWTLARYPAADDVGRAVARLIDRSSPGTPA
jgi:hypothetical protein